MIMAAKDSWDPGPAFWDLMGSGGAPHETGGVLRAHRAGLPGPELAKTLKLPGDTLMNAIQGAMDEEANAHTAGIPIHDSAITAKEAAAYLKEAEPS